MAKPDRRYRGNIVLFIIKRRDEAKRWQSIRLGTRLYYSRFRCMFIRNKAKGTAILIIPTEQCRGCQHLRNVLLISKCHKSLLIVKRKYQ